MSLSIGSLGLLYGLRVQVRELRQQPAEAFRLLFAEALATFVLVAAVFGAFFYYVLPLGSLREAATAALALGATASVSTPTALAAVRQRFRATGPLPDLLEFAVRYDRVLGIVLFGLIFCIFHEGETRGIRPLTITEWVAVNMGFGALLGVLFFLFLGREESRSKLLVALIGIVVFASGVAYYLHLSPLFINLMLGIILGNTSRVREVLVEVLESIEKPVFVVVLVFAGAAWNLQAAVAAWPTAFGLAALYLVVRAAGKRAGGYATYVASDAPELLSSRLGNGLLAQGGVAVAMAVTFSQVYQHAYTNLVVTCVLVSVVVSEFFGPRLARDMLVDAEQVAVAA